MEIIRIINEPTAASLAYGIHNRYKEKQNSQTVLIYDFGGGTFDVTIVNIENNNFEVKNTNGEAYLGGDDIDINLTNHFVEEFKEKHNIDLTKNKKSIRRLRSQCEKLKKDLTFSETAAIQVDYIFSDGTNTYNLVSSLDRNTFNQINDTLFNRTLDCVEKTLLDAKLTKDDIDQVILVGGSSRIPYVRKLIKDYFNKELNDCLNPDEAVARGAAIQAAMLNKTTINEKLNLLLHDVCPLSLGIEIHEGQMNVIIPRNTRIPVMKKKTYETSERDITDIPIIVYEGESTLVKRNRKLGRFLIKIPRSSKGAIKFHVFFYIDVDGILNVYAQMLTGEIMKDLKINMNRGYDENEIQKMIDDAAKHREADEQIKELKLAKYELREFVSSFEDELINYELDDEDLKLFKDTSDEIHEWLKQNNITVELCKQKMQFVDEEFLPILTKYKMSFK